MGNRAVITTEEEKRRKFFKNQQEQTGYELQEMIDSIKEKQV